MLETMVGDFNVMGLALPLSQEARSRDKAATSHSLVLLLAVAQKYPEGLAASPLLEPVGER